MGEKRPPIVSLGVEGLETVAQLNQGACQQPADVHLADADLIGDLGLRHVVEEPQLHDHAFAFGKIGEHAFEQHSVLGEVETVIARRRGGVRGVVDSEPSRGCASSDDERYAPPTSIASSTSSSVTPSSAATSGIRGGRLSRCDKLVDDVAEPEVEFLRAARHAYRPRLVAEVALELAFDGRGRERRELEPAIGIEAFDRFQHAEVGDLQEVVERLAAVGEPAREMRRQRLVRLDQFVAQSSDLPVCRVLDELRA